jgi:hypothetical protein
MNKRKLPELPPGYKWDNCRENIMEVWTTANTRFKWDNGEDREMAISFEERNGKIDVEVWKDTSVREGDWYVHATCDTMEEAQHVAAQLCWLGMTGVEFI